jgi:hypothetical protein
VNSLNLTPPAPDPIVVHPGVVVAMLHLLPSIGHIQETQVKKIVGKVKLKENGDLCIYGSNSSAAHLACSIVGSEILKFISVFTTVLYAICIKF